MTPCPECSHPHTSTIDVDRHPSGTIRRRHECRACRHRWTHYEGAPPGRRGGWPAGQPWAGAKRLTAAEVEAILLSPPPTRQLAEQTGRSRWAITQVRTGRTYARVCPDLPRRQAGISCLQCCHWSGRCGMGFPDPVEEGLGFAAECEMFSQS